ncbi:hypothetical protein DMUE_4786 [Dictyocoela muelleri]|nr:hypothetical protein DMUE_4786 [Dictyocoela muelleri]
MLENIDKQDLFDWKGEFLQTVQIAGWDEQTASKVLKSSISTSYFDLIKNFNTPGDIISALFRYKYSEKNHVKYLNQLAKTKQNHFLRISQYRDDMVRILKN